MDEFDVVTIEDDDGFTTQWNWPREKLGLANSVAIEMLEQAHDRLKSLMKDKI